MTMLWKFKQQQAATLFSKHFSIPFAVVMFHLPPVNHINNSNNNNNTNKKFFRDFLHAMKHPKKLDFLLSSKAAEKQVL